MVDTIFYIDCFLCLAHLIGSALLWRSIREFAIFLGSYILFTVGVCAVIFATWHFLPEPMGFGGMVFLLPLGFPVIVTAPIVILLRTIRNLKELSEQRRGLASVEAPRVDATPQPSDRPVGRDRPHDWTMLPPSTEPKANALRDFLCIGAFSTIILCCLPFVGFVLSEVVGGMFPHTTRPPGSPPPVYVPPNPVLLTLQAVITNIVVVEIVWQFWTRRISRPGETLYKRPIPQYALMIFLFCVPPLLGYKDLVREHVQSITATNPVQEASVRPAYHSGLRLQATPTAEVILAGSVIPMSDLHMNDEYAIWLEHPDARTSGPQMGVYRFRDSTTERIGLPFFANSDGYTDTVRVYMVGDEAIVIGWRQISVVDLNNRTVTSGGYQNDPVKASTQARLVYPSRRWVVMAGNFEYPSHFVIDLSNFRQRSLAPVAGDMPVGMTQDALIVRNGEDYFSIDLATFARTPLDGATARWLPLSREGVVLESHKIMPSDREVKLVDTDGNEHDINTGLPASTIAVTDNSLFWTQSGLYDSSRLLRTNIATGKTERVLNAPALDGNDYGLNDGYFLETSEVAIAFDASNVATYPCQVKLVPIKTAPAQ